MRSLRIARGLRQTDLAVPGHVSRSMVGALERGEILAPSARVVAALATRLGVSVNDLIHAPEDRAVITRRLARAENHLRKRRPQLTLMECHAILPHVRRLRDGPLLAHVDQILAEAHLSLGNYQRTARWSALAVLRTLNLEERTSEAIVLLAESLLRLHYPELAISLYQIWLRHLATPPSTEEATLRLHLGNAYQASFRHRQAARTYRRTIVIARRMKLTELEGWALVGLASALQARGEVDAALSTVAQATAIARRGPYPPMEISARSVEIRTLISTLSIPQARALLEAECASTPDDTEDRINAALLYETLAELEWWQKQWHPCLQAAEKGLAILGEDSGLQAIAVRGRLLWATALAYHALDDRRANVYREWAQDLLRIARVDMSILPDWPDGTPL